MCVGSSPPCPTPALPPHPDADLLSLGSPAPSAPLCGSTLLPGGTLLSPTQLPYTDHCRHPETLAGSGCCGASSEPAPSERCSGAGLACCRLRGWRRSMAASRVSGFQRRQQHPAASLCGPGDHQRVSALHLMRPRSTHPAHP